MSCCGGEGSCRGVWWGCVSVSLVEEFMMSEIF